MNRPDRIEKRIFKCSICDYSIQVYGEMYFDSGCHNYIATFKCKDCQILFEQLVSQINMNKDYSEASHGLADSIICLRCGGSNNQVWNKTKGICPKCSGKMDYKIEGSITVKFVKKTV